MVLWGFWTTYYSNPLQFSDLLVHVHGFSMTLWCAMLVTQAALIRTGKRSLHRTIGKTSYVLAPLIVVLLVAVARARLLKDLPPDGVIPEELFFLAGLTLLGASAFGVLYVWAIFSRKNAPTHGRIMLCTVFPIATAAGDRILAQYFPDFVQSLPIIAGRPQPQVVTWVVVDVTLVGLSVWDWRAHRRLNVFPIVLLLLLGYHLFTANAHHIGPWKSFATWFLGFS